MRLWRLSKHWVQRKMQSVKDSKTTVLYETRICCDNMKASTEVTFSSYWTEVPSTTKRQPHSRVTILEHSKAHHDHCSVVSLQPTNRIIRYIYTTVSGQYSYADWLECNLFRESVPPFFIGFYPDKDAREYANVMNTWYVCPLSPMCTSCGSFTPTVMDPKQHPVRFIHWRFQSFDLPKLVNQVFTTRLFCTLHNSYLNKHVTKQNHVT
jgi:hypothetical protein